MDDETTTLTDDEISAWRKSEFAATTAPTPTATTRNDRRRRRRRRRGRLRRGRGDADAADAEALDRAIEPVAAEGFLAEHWEQSRSSSRAGEEGRFDDLLSTRTSSGS